MSTRDADFMGFRKELGARIRQARAVAGLTQTQVAQALKKRDATVSDYERGVSVPPAEEVVALAGILAVSVQWLMTGEHLPMATVTESPGLRSFLTTPIGQSLTTDERRALASIRIEGEPPTELTYQALLVGLRGTR